MKRIIFFILILTIEIIAQNKFLFDISKDEYANNSTLRKIAADISDQVSNSKISASLLSGGYFTIGTVNGLSSSTFDNKCDILFGHPYAKTSYPVFSLDGMWYKLDEYFSSSEIKMSKTGDTLKIQAEKMGIVSVLFKVFISNNGNGIYLNQSAKNLDVTSHKISLGLVIDPALGKWGDGKIEAGSDFMQSTRVYNQSDMPSSFNIWEKNTGAKGIGINISYDNPKPDKIIISNWNDIYNSPFSSFPTISKLIYDLDLEMIWSEKDTKAYESYQNSVLINLINPDFSSPLFLRWDLQNFFTVQNGELFPQNFTTYVEVNKNSSTVGSATVKLELPSFITATTDYNVNLGTTESTLLKVSLTSHFKYFDKTEEIVAKIDGLNNGSDEIRKMIYMPATPVSDSGLVVKIDSINTSSFPKIDFRFAATRKSSGAKISDLTTDNLFLYEDGNNITNFELSKDMSSGENSVDIVFVLDVTGSMGGTISSVKNNIIEFADSIKFRGIDYRFGMVTFLDAIENIYGFTNDISLFKSKVDLQYAHGGDDSPENSLQALLEASKFSFRENCSRIIIWITDATYHENDSFTSLTKSDVLNSLLLNGIKVHAIGPTMHNTAWYAPIINPTGGNFYDIYGKFRDIFLDISRLQSSGKYILSYNSTKSVLPSQIKLQVRYSGLGGEAIITPSEFHPKTQTNLLACFPNPFNPEITFTINKSTYSNGELFIYNSIGQLVKSFIINNNTTKINWQAKNEFGNSISSGFYIAKLILKNSNSELHTEAAKILFLK